MKLYNLFLLLVVGLTGCPQATTDASSAPDFQARPAATPPPATEQKSGFVVPIIELNIGGLLGGAKDGQWLGANKVAAGLQANADYQIYNLENSAKSSAKGEAPVNEPPCEDFYDVKLNANAKTNGVAFGAEISWNPIPRPVKSLAVNSAIYRKIAAETLAGKQLTVRDAKVTQIFQIDLDGDGTDEVILTATSFKNGLSSRSEAGDYSFVLLRKVINGKAANMILDGDFIVKSANMGAPAEYKVSSIADLNGDGKMEIVIYAQYYEGEWAEVFELDGSQAKSVEQLKIACGV